MELTLKYHIYKSQSPIWTFAIHDGHYIDKVLEPYLLLNTKDRLREEDPFTSIIAELPTNQLIVSTSRFQTDLNRNVENAIYLSPTQAWGLHVWHNELPNKYIDELLNIYHTTYNTIKNHIKETIDRYGYFIILDIHSYNAKRLNKDQEIDEVSDPQINMGTYYNHKKWSNHIANYLKSLKSKKLYNQPIDIRENVKFKGGNLAQEIIKDFGEYGYVLSVEFRKDFMDEWTGEPDMEKIIACQKLLSDSLVDLQNPLL